MLPDIPGLLVLPRLRVQNANAISSQMTWGFPSMSAFTGLMQALERKLAGRVALQFHAVGVVCHGYQAQTSGDYVRRFNLTRNPVDKEGNTAPIVEEGRIHLDITLVFGVEGDALFDEAGRHAIAATVGQVVSTMRIAGGTIVPQWHGSHVYRAKPQLLSLAEDGSEERTKQFRRLARQWLPGFALVARDDLLHSHLAALRQSNANATLLDAWLDKGRLNHWPETSDQGKTVWRHSREPGNGWIVPIPVGYGALSDLLAPSGVANARDDHTEFRFVESVYSLGEWLSPHRLGNVLDLLWYSNFDEGSGVYRCCNDYSRG